MAGRDGWTHQSHTGQFEENPESIPDTLQLFYKSPSSVIGPNDEIVLPEGAENVHYESEMVVVIGKEAQDVPVEEAGEYVLGVTCGNDVTARDWQTQDMQWWRGKGADTFAAVGLLPLNPPHASTPPCSDSAVLRFESGDRSCSATCRP